MNWTLEWKQTQSYKGIAYFLEDGQRRFSMAIDRNSQFETAEEIVNVLNAAVAAEQEQCALVAERVGEALKEAGIGSDYCWLIATNIRNMHQECKAADELEAFIAKTKGKDTSSQDA